MVATTSYGLISRIYIYPNSRIMKKSYGVPKIRDLRLNFYLSPKLSGGGVFGGFFGAHPCLIESGIDQFYWNQTFKSHCLEAALLHQYFVADNAGCPFRAIHALLSLRLTRQRLALDN